MNDGETIRENARTVDLCPEHVGELETLAALFISRGVPAGLPSAPPPSKRRNYDADNLRTCPVCGFVSAHRAALAAHLRREHGARLSEFPSLALPEDGRNAPMTCPECGGTYGGAQGLGAHRRSAHGVIGTKSKPNGPGRPAQPELAL